MKEKLVNIYNALNTLEVKGKSNCGIVVGVMGVIEQMIIEINSQEAEKNE